MDIFWNYTIETQAITVTTCTVNVNSKRVYKYLYSTAHMKLNLAKRARFERAASGLRYQDNYCI